MKLNRRGYLTVEIILSSVIAFSIAFFLIALVMRLSSKNDDAYLDLNLTTDKGLIIKNIDERANKNVSNGTILGIKNVTNNGDKYIFTYSDDSTKTLEITKEEEYYVVRFDDYAKKLNSNLTDVSVMGTSYGDIYNIRMSAKTMYSDTDYGFNMSFILNG